MWTWERERRSAAREPDAQLGLVTIGGEEAAVNVGGERRWLSLCAPGGCTWRPGEGDQVLVLKTDDPARSCVLGTVGTAEGLEPGEIRLSGRDCEVLLGEMIRLRGAVEINGEGLEEMIRRIAAGILSGG